MSGPQGDRPFWNQLLSALMLAVVGFMFYGVLCGILTIFCYGIGWMPGALGGAIHGAFESRRMPLRECIVLFVSTFVSALLLGIAANWNDWSFVGLFAVGLGAPAIGIILRALIARLGPERCRGVAMTFAGVFCGAWLAILFWAAYRPID